MKIKKILSIFLSMFMTCGSTMSMNVNAAEYYRLVDNDPIASGYTYYFSSNMQYYSGMTNSYNYDMRCSNLLNSSISAHTYWNYPLISLNNITTIVLRVYLNDNSFTEPDATYSINTTGGSSYHDIAHINQNNAYPGWNIVNYTGMPNYVTTTSAKVVSSGTANVRLGSDAIRVSLIN